MRHLTNVDLPASEAHSVLTNNRNHIANVLQKTVSASRHMALSYGVCSALNHNHMNFKVCINPLSCAHACLASSNIPTG